MGLRAVVQLVDRVVGVQRLVAVELENRAVQLVGARLGDDVDDGAACAPYSAENEFELT
jgi:hypothetical protein